jgi:cytidylate kinase
VENQGKRAILDGKVGCQRNRFCQNDLFAGESLKKGVEKMSVITISRDFGSEGDYIAERIAQTLGYHFVDKEFFSTVLSEYGLVEFDREYDTLPGFWQKFYAQRYERRDEVVQMLNRVIRAVAQHGNVVILGRSGFEVLGGFANMIHVRLQAPLPVRIARVTTELKIPFEQAEELVKENDKVHIAFTKEYYKIPWDEVHAFDLVINTGKIPPDLATTWLADTLNALGTVLEPDKPIISSIEIDPILKTAVSNALKCTMTHK